MIKCTDNPSLQKLQRGIIFLEKQHFTAASLCLQLPLVPVHLLRKLSHRFPSNQVPLLISLYLIYIKHLIVHLYPVPESNWVNCSMVK